MSKDVADLDLCKELYELSGWKSSHHFHGDGGIFECNNKPDTNIPAYDLGYLMRKLPKYIFAFGEECRLEIVPQGFSERGLSAWCTCYESRDELINFLNVDDSPENALCKLAIELFKQGILKKDSTTKHNTSKEKTDE